MVYLFIMCHAHYYAKPDNASEVYEARVQWWNLHANGQARAK